MDSSKFTQIQLKGKFPVRSQTRTAASGFALVPTLILLAMFVVLLTMASLMVINAQRVANAERDLLSAQKSAMTGLEIALGELQTAAGPDTRTTATASVLASPSNLYKSVTLPAGRGHEAWTGIWKSRTVDLVDAGGNVLEAKGVDVTKPDERTGFVNWLVSSTDGAGNFTLPDAVSDVENTLPDPITLARDAAGNPYLGAGRVKIDEVKRGERYFAFAVEDEGVKADLSWNENPAPGSAQRDTRFRITAAPGPDYTAFNESGLPFTSVPNTPLDINTTPILKDSISLLRDPADLQSLLNADTLWLKENRRHLTKGSRGIMVDVRKGGLRRDLSLAFEMDGDADLIWGSNSFTESPTKFFQQTGEFTSASPASDMFASVVQLGGMTARYVYADRFGGGLPFSDDLLPGSNEYLVVRGPTWSAMRDYANMYKRLQGTSGDYGLTARPHFPNFGLTAGVVMTNKDGAVLNRKRSLVAIPQQENYPTLYDRTFVTGGAGGRNFSDRPSKTNYAPVLLGMVSTLSVSSVRPEGAAYDILAVSMDPVFYLWNPYNRDLSMDRYAIGYKNSSPGSVKLWATNAAGTTIEGISRIDQALAQTAGTVEANQNRLSVSISDLSFEPGEVKIFSPTTDKTELRNGAGRHPFNTEAFERDETVVDTNSGVLITKFLIGGKWQEVRLDAYEDITAAYGFNGIDGSTITGFLPSTATTNFQLRTSATWTNQVYSTQPRFTFYATAPDAFEFEPKMLLNLFTKAEGISVPTEEIPNTKQFFGVFSLLQSPADSSTNPLEFMAQFNPLAISTQGNELSSRLGSWNQQGVFITSDFPDHSVALERAGVVLPALSDDIGNGYWGGNFGDLSGAGSTHLSVIDIPSAPPISLAQFGHANLGIRDNVPLHAVGNSFASIFVDPVSPYGQLSETHVVSPRPGIDDPEVNVEDVSWCLNNALFDHYYLSGLAPNFSIKDTGYSPDGTLKDTLNLFFEVEEDSNYWQAKANPVLRPYFPPGMSGEAIVDDLDPEKDPEGYRKLGAYSMINGAFNVNSTSVKAWEALLKSNRDLTYTDVAGVTDSESGTPFPKSAASMQQARSQPLWSGLSRLDDAQVNSLATEIVNQVKLRGPFMNLADFVNHRVGATTDSSTRYMGALQRAIEDSGINDDVRANAASGQTVNYASSDFATNLNNPIPGNRPTVTGIVTDITQADLLLPLAPRMTARSDTFRIRAYGEIRRNNDVVSKAVCEAVVQRFPEYVNADTDPSGQDADADTNEIWDDAIDLSALNLKFGREFRVVQFRWLSPEEI